MRIFFYPPFKPLDHPNPSGDLATAQGLVRYLEDHGCQVHAASSLRARWITRTPRLWPRVLGEKRRVSRDIARLKPDVWLTYHTYYKAPDLLGPGLCRRWGLPYAIFQGIYSTKRRREIGNLPGFLLNRRALTEARHIFSNRLEDMVNLLRLIPEDRLTYVAPGIEPGRFAFDPQAREALRREWGVGEAPVVLSAAMFRPDVKTQGLLWTIAACGLLLDQGVPLFLAIAGDGAERDRIARAARERLGDHFRLVGKIPRDLMHRFYSAGDVFAFPGFNETLGMVYLEAQACGLPIVACRNGGIPEVAAHNHTGFLTPLGDMAAFAQAIHVLIRNPEQRRTMGATARKRVRTEHDLDNNYGKMLDILKGLVDG